MGKTTPGSLHLTHHIMYHGNYTGDENLQIVNHIAVIDNYVYIDGINTGVSVKGEPGKSAYQSYVDICNAQGVTPVSEQEWVETMDTVTYIGGDGVQSDYAETDTTAMSYIKNKPLSITKTDEDTIDITF